MMNTKNDALPDFHVRIEFGRGISNDAQARAMMALERYLRMFTKEDIWVLKHTMADDSKLRRFMTQEQRDKL